MYEQVKILLLVCISIILPACFKEKPPQTDKIKCIVFDFDGTIADSYPLAIHCINALASEYGYKPINDEEARTTLRDKSMRDIVHDRLGLSFYQLPLFTYKVKKIFAGKLPKIAIFAGMKDLLDDLAASYDIAIITSNMQGVVCASLQRAQIRCVKEIDSDSSLFGKHVVIERFLKKHHLATSQILYVGDEVRDIEACQKIGVKIIAVTWGYNSLPALRDAKPDYLAHSCNEIGGIIGNKSSHCEDKQSSLAA